LKKYENNKGKLGNKENTYFIIVGTFVLLHLNSLISNALKVSYWKYAQQ